METARSAVLLATILILVYWAAHQPKPVEVVEVKYCLQDLYVAQKQILVMPNGSPVIKDGKLVERWVKFWAPGYGPCSEMDRYEEA